MGWQPGVESANCALRLHAFGHALELLKLLKDNGHHLRGPDQAPARRKLNVSKAVRAVIHGFAKTQQVFTKFIVESIGVSVYDRSTSINGGCQNVPQLPQFSRA